MLKAAKPKPSGRGDPPEPPTQEGGKDRQIPSGIAFPPIHDVYEDDWKKEDPPFDKHTALRVVIDEDAKGQDVHEFHVNMDNIYLKTELKATGREPELIRARWRFGLVLLGLAVLHQDAQTNGAKTKTRIGRRIEDNGDIEGASVDAKIEEFGKAVAPFLLPIIDSLGALDTESTLAVDDSGEAM